MPDQVGALQVGDRREHAAQPAELRACRPLAAATAPWRVPRRGRPASRARPGAWVPARRRHRASSGSSWPPARRPTSARAPASPPPGTGGDRLLRHVQDADLPGERVAALPERGAQAVPPFVDVVQDVDDTRTAPDHGSQSAAHLTGSARCPGPLRGSDLQEPLRELRGLLGPVTELLHLRREHLRVPGVELLEGPLERGVVHEQGGVLGSVRRTPDGAEQCRVEDRAARLLGDPESPRELVRQHADLQPLLERDTRSEVGGQGERGEQLGDPGLRHALTLERSGPASVKDYRSPEVAGRAARASALLPLPGTWVLVLAAPGAQPVAHAVGIAVSHPVVPAQPAPQCLARWRGGRRPVRSDCHRPHPVCSRRCSPAPPSTVRVELALGRLRGPCSCGRPTPMPVESATTRPATTSGRARRRLSGGGRSVLQHRGAQHVAHPTLPGGRRHAVVLDAHQRDAAVGER